MRIAVIARDRRDVGIDLGVHGDHGDPGDL